MARLCGPWHHLRMERSEGGAGPAHVCERADLVAQLDLLRRQAARGSGRPAVSIERIAQLAGMPRSTVHTYVSGVRLPPPDALDAIVLALGADGETAAEWAEALERVASAEAVARVPSLDSGATTIPRQLPACPAGFMGRVAETRRLEESRAGVLAVTGAGGVGKTALVLRWAHSAQDRYQDGQVWIDLRGFSASAPLDPGDALEQLLRASGVGTIDLPADVGARAAMFRSAVAERRMLIILDNARDSAQVRSLLPGAAGVTTVVTSRDALHSLVVRDGAERVPVERLDVDEARSLLVHGLDRDIAESDAAKRIAARCEGLPLALRIVRERLSTASRGEVERFADQLDIDHESLLEALAVVDFSDDISVRGALRWSYDALPPDAAAAFRYVPLCLVPTFDVRCMAVLLDRGVSATRRLLDLLVAASLLDVADTDHYRVHDLVAAFAGECLRLDAVDVDVGDARIRLLRCICAISAAALRHSDAGRPIRLEWPAGLPTLSTRDQSDMDGASAIQWVARNVEVVCAAVIDAARVGPIEYSWLAAERGWRALRWAMDSGRLEEALDTACQAATAGGNSEAAAFMRRLLGITYARHGQLDLADDALTKAIDLSLSAGRPRAAAMDRSNRAIVWSMRGELTRAIAEMSDVAAELESPSERLPTLIELVELELRHGDVRAACRWLSEVRAVPFEHWFGTALTLEVELASALVELATGHPEEAGRIATVVEDSAAASSNTELRARALVVQARSLIACSDLDGALAFAERAIDAARAGAAQQFQVDALCALAEIKIVIGRVGEATPLLDQARTLTLVTNIRHHECQVLALSALACAESGDLSGAARFSRAAKRIASECGYSPLVAETARLLGSLQPGSARGRGR